MLTFMSREKYGVRGKYLQLAQEMDHSPMGSAEDREADSRQTYAEWQESRTDAEPT